MNTNTNNNNSSEVVKPKETAAKQPVGLAAVVADDAVFALAKQRESLNFFIKSQLKDSIDFGVIPGTPKPTLLKPGAEKLANIFQLGSRIVNSDTKIDHERRFVFCTYAIELFHLPSGKTIAQCEGSANSLERRYLKQDPYSVLNTLQKMAQKRAFVGAVIQACNASDFFTQDLEDMDLQQKRDLLSPQNQRMPGAGAMSHAVIEGSVIRWGKYKGKTVDEAAQDDRFMSYCDWIVQQSEGKKDKQGFMMDALAWKEFLATRKDSGVDAGKNEESHEENRPHTEHRSVA